MDSVESNNHVFAYYTRVSHSFSQQSMTTNVSFTHAQTFGEFFATLGDQLFEDKITSLTADTPSSAPQHPLSELRDRFQINEPARQYYQTMFWGDVDLNTPDPIIFDIFNVLAVRNPDGSVVPIGFPNASPEEPAGTDRSVEEIQAERDTERIRLSRRAAEQQVKYDVSSKFAFERQVQIVADLDTEIALAKRRDAAILSKELRGSSGQPLLNGYPNLVTGEPPEYVVQKAYEDLFTDSRKAFAYGSRPICTLEQYIDLKGEAGLRQGRREPTNPTEGKGAVYYVKIFDIDNSPLTPVTRSTDGLGCGPVGTDTRRSWEERLLAFRGKVYTSRNHYKA